MSTVILAAWGAVSCGSTEASHAGPGADSDAGSVVDAFGALEGAAGTNAAGYATNGVSSGEGAAGPAQAAAEADAQATSPDGSASAFSEGPHVAQPELIDRGGPVLTAAEIVTVTFPADANNSTWEDLGSNITLGMFWDNLRQYCGPNNQCVGDAGPAQNVRLTTAPAEAYTDSADPSRGSSMRTFLESEIGSGALPAPNGQTIYVLYFPATTTITMDGSVSCHDFGGYHLFAAHDGVSYAYAIIPSCAPEGPLSPVQETTFAASHEIAEATTDPFPSSSSDVAGINLIPSSGHNGSFLPWYNFLGDEVADLCVDIFGLGQDETAVGSLTVQRIWSATAAAAGHDPCFPAPSANPYFNVAPRAWLLTAEVGQTATLTANAFSDAPIDGGWTLSADDFLALTSGSKDANEFLAFSFDGATQRTVHNGDTVEMTVTLKKDPGPSGALGLLKSKLVTGAGATLEHPWPFMVLTAADEADAGLGGVDPNNALSFAGRARQVVHRRARARP